jgi:prepilin-type N-terminal cleavage/methylation domain-containing protein
MPHQQAKTGGARQKGFTLVELLIVIGIITVLAALLLPMTMRARKSAARIKMQGTLQTLSAGLEAYNQAWQSYPVFDNRITATPNDHSGTTIGNTAMMVDCGAHALFTGLICRYAPHHGGQDYGPFVNVDNLKVDRVNHWIVDDYDKPILYFPAADPRPNVGAMIGPTQSVRGFVASGNVVNGTNVSPLYDYRAVNQTIPTPGRAALNAILPKLADMQVLLGDADKSGMINGSETPRTTQPYLLWMAGFDGVFGFPTGTTKTDDVANFDFPPQYVR